MKNPAKETDTVTLFLRIPESLKQFLSTQAKNNGNSINREIILCLEKKMSEAMRYLPVNTTFMRIFSKKAERNTRKCIISATPQHHSIIKEII